MQTEAELAIMNDYNADLEGCLQFERSDHFLSLGRFTAVYFPLTSMNTFAAYWLASDNILCRLLERVVSPLSHE